MFHCHDLISTFTVQSKSYTYVFMALLDKSGSVIVSTAIYEGGKKRCDHHLKLFTKVQISISHSADLHSGQWKENSCEGPKKKSEIFEIFEASAMTTTPPWKMSAWILENVPVISNPRDGRWERCPPSVDPPIKHEIK